MSLEQSPSRRVGHVPDVLEALGIKRSSLYKLMKNDAAFPAPVLIGGRLTFFLDEIEAYKVTRPRRQYTNRAA